MATRRAGTWTLRLHQVGRGVASGSGAADSKHLAETALFETSPLAWDASAEAVQEALLALGCVGSDVHVVRANLTHPYGGLAWGEKQHFGYRYDVTFRDYVGDLPLLEPNFAATLVGGTVNATAVVDGTCEHVKTEAAPLVLETQVVRVAGEEPFEGSFSLGFRGHSTSRLAWDATAAEVQAALEALLPVGSVQVNRSAVAGEGAYGFEHSVTFLPTAKCDRRHALSYGDLPALTAAVHFEPAAAGVSGTNATVTVYSGGVPSPSGRATADGASPFGRTAKVVSSAVSAAHSTAVDLVGVFGQEGLRSASPPS